MKVKNNQLPFKDSAKFYVDSLGFALVPNHPGTKVPYINEWQKNPITSTQGAKAYWEKHDDSNIGVHLGESRLITVDVDAFKETHIALKAVGINFEELLNAPGAVRIEGNPKKAKLIYQSPEAFQPPQTKCVLRWAPHTILELRTGPNQDILPPSIHPSGEPYRWIPKMPQSRNEIPYLPPVLQDLWENWVKKRATMLKACPWWEELEKTAKVANKDWSGTKQSSGGYGGEGWDAVRAQIRERLPLPFWLDKIGAQYADANKFRCPFHPPDNNPSFAVFQANEGYLMWVCFHSNAPVGISTSNGYTVGDVIDIYAYHHNMTVGPATATVAKELGIPLPKETIPNEGSSPNSDKAEIINKKTDNIDPKPTKAIPFPKSACRSIFKVYLESQKGASEVCNAFHFAALMTIIGGLLGRSVYVYSGQNLYLNFYTCLMGPTGRSRKSTAMRKVQNLLDAADPNVIILNGLSTPEGLIAKLSIPDGEDSSDEILQARIDATSVHEGFRLIATINEFAQLLKKARRETSNGLIPCLTDAYDCPPSLDNPTRHSPLIAKNPVVAVIALSTQEWFEESFRVEDIHGGFANRFCFYLHEETEPIPRPKTPDQKALSWLVGFLHKKRQQFQGKHIQFTFDDEAGLKLDDWYLKNRELETQRKNHIVNEALQRLDTNMRKLALLYAVLENEPDDHEIHHDHLASAIQVADYWEATATEIFGMFAKDKQSKNETRILKQIQKNPGKVYEIRKRIGGNMSSRDFNDALNALIKSELVIYSGNKKLICVDG